MASSRGLVRSGFGAALYEHGSVKIVALEQKDSPFAAIPSGFAPVVGLRLHSSPISTTGHRCRENGRPPLESAICEPVCPLFHPGSAIRPLYILMPIKSAKVCASTKIFFRAGHGLPVPAVPVGLQAEPSNLLMHIDRAKTIALAAKNYPLGRRCQRWSPLSRPQLTSYLY